MPANDMNTPSEQNAPPRPEWQNLFNALRQLHPDLAEHLQAAVTLVQQPGGMQLKLAAHALREFGRQFPRALGIEMPRDQKQEEMKELAAQWKSQPSPTPQDAVAESAGSLSPDAETVDIPIHLYSETHSLMRAMSEGDDFVQVMVASLRQLDPLADATFHQRAEPGVRHWVRLHGWFVGRCHAPRLDALEAERQTFLDNFGLYEASLQAMLGPAIETIPALVELTNKPPTEANLNLALALLKKAEPRKRFFRALQDPAWLLPLEKAGAFQEPYSLVKQGDLTSFPWWPPSDYLKRIASSAPTDVARILLKVGLTDNHTVRGDVVEAALEMPAETAAKLVPVFRGWLQRPLFARVPSLLAKLCVKLAKEGQSPVALRLLRSLLYFDVPVQGVRALAAVRPRVEHYEYEMVLKEIEHALVEVDGVALLDVLCNTLRSVITLEHGKDSDDHSWIWMEDLYGKREFAEGAKQALAAAITRTATALSARSVEDATKAIQRLDRESFLIFKRVRMHASAEAITGTSLASAPLLDQGTFASEVLRPEYDRLLAARWSELAAADQKQIVGWITKGPDAQWLIDSETNRTGHPPEQAMVDEYIRSWQLARLDGLADQLSGEDLEFLRTLESTAQPLPPPYSGVTTWVGPTSPVSEEELKSQTPTEVIQLLQTWQPKPGFMEHSREGMARTFSGAVAARAMEWSGVALQFKPLDPTYVRSLLSGLEPAARANQSLDWGAILGLCSWVMEQPREFEQPRTREEDPDWSWARRTIASLLRGGLRRDLGLPFEHRELVWSILERLGRDPSPSPEQEEHLVDDLGRDAATIALNSVRGETLHAVIEYALWCVRNLQALGQSPSNWMNVMSEVRASLDTVLDSRQEPSVAVKSVLAHYLPNLSFLDRVWLEGSLPEIFQDLGPVWNTYLRYAQVHGAVVPLLLPFYLKAAQRSESALEDDKPSEARMRLAEHLLLLEAYFGAKDARVADILTTFFATAPVPQRAHLIEFAGRHAEEAGRALPADALDRIMKLVDARVAAASRAHDAGELADFAVLFSGDAFPDDWLLRIAKVIMPMSPGHRFEHQMAERLGSIAESNLAGAMEILLLASSKDLGPMGSYMWRDHAEKILRLALASGHNLREQARTVINNFTEQGYGEFERLLE